MTGTVGSFVALLTNSPVGWSEPSFRFFDPELDNRDAVGVAMGSFTFAACRGVDSSSGSAKLSFARPWAESSKSGACRILSCRFLGRIPSSSEFSFEGVGCAADGRTAEVGADGAGFAC